MKLSFTLISTFLISNAIDGAAEAECPASNTTTTPCHSLYDPLLCGDCEYSNSCFAATAGFTTNSDCISKPSCNEPPMGTICTMEFSPVVCSNGDCEFSNPCNAQAAGYDVDAECVPKGRGEDLVACATPSTDTICNTLYRPVMCDSTCQYSNDCQATSAGYSLEQCCPVVDPDATCPDIYEPLKCGLHDCEYGNTCSAENAGYNVADECVSADATTPTPTEVECPTSLSDTFCIDLYAPVVCGASECEYSNECYAEIAGFNIRSNCTPKGPVCPTPDASIVCRIQYDPYVCNDNCEYSSSCWAEAAGFDIATDCVSSGPFFCFSGSSFVTVKNAGLVPLEDVQVGDEVLVGGDKFERIYSFGHRDTKRQATFLQFLPSGLELSENHLVFVEGQGPIPASMVKIGDQLSNGETVQRILSVVRTGVYNPFTPSGTIVVNGVKASNYIAIQDGTPVLMLGDFNTGLTFQWLEHTFQFPHRVWCHYLGFEDTMSESGLSGWSERPLVFAMWCLNQNVVVMTGLLLPFLVTMLVFVVMDSLFYVILLGAAVLFLRRSGIQEMKIEPF